MTFLILPPNPVKQRNYTEFSFKTVLHIGVWDMTLKRIKWQCWKNPERYSLLESLMVTDIAWELRSTYNTLGSQKSYWPRFLTSAATYFCKALRNNIKELQRTKALFYRRVHLLGKSLYQAIILESKAVASTEAPDTLPHL